MEIELGDFAWGNPSRALEKVQEMKVLFDLHREIWTEEMLQPPFLFYYQRVLAPQERRVVDLKLQGLSTERVAKRMKLSLKTIIRYVYNIRYVYRNKCRNRVYKTWEDVRGRDNPKDSSGSPSVPY